jgi:cyclophilin family peptidyl-prolyl cis-trans isomerase
VAKSTHDKQLERARQKRQQDALARRQNRSRLIVFLLVGLLVLSLLGAALLSGRDDTGTPVVDDDPATAPDDGEAATAPDDGEEAAEDPQEAAREQLAAGERPEGACEPTPDDVPEVDSELYDAPPEMGIEEDATYTATIATTCGDIVVELDAARAPVTVNNFVFLAEEGYYEGVGFHRVIDDFMIQGGDPAGTGCGREDCLSPGGVAFPGYTFEDELEAAQAVTEEEGGYPQGALAMANAGPDTNGSQFFIIDAPEGYPLPPDYTLFGRVIEGIEVVESIALGPAAGDTAADPVIITAVTVEQA